MKVTYFSTIGLLIIILNFTSCKDSKIEPYKLPPNAIELISGNDEKVWKLAKRLNNNIRMNMGDCFLSYRQSYRTNMTMNDNNSEHSDLW